MLYFRKPIGTVGYMGGVPVVMEEFCWSLAQMIQYGHEYLCQPYEYVHLDRAPMSYHSTARNYLSARVLGDWLLMLDTDHAFGPDLLGRMVGLLQKHSLDVLTAVYRYRVPPYFPNLFRWNEEMGAYMTVAELDWSQPLRQMDCFGAGTMLVRRTVFDRIRREMKQEPFNVADAPNGAQFSEDFSFIWRCRQLGIKTWVSPMIESVHLRVHGVTHADYQRDQVQTVPMPEGGELVRG